MGELVVLITAVVFFCIGKYSTTNIESGIIRRVKSKLKLKHKPNAGSIPFKTPEEREAELSGDKALQEEWEKSGIADLVRN